LNTPVHVLLDLVLPNANHPPTQFPQFGKVALVPPSIDFDFHSPKFGETFAPPRESVPVPKIAINENDYACVREHDIRTAGKCAHMLSKTPTASEQRRAHGTF
jgi:hypothetical protein